LAARNFGLGKNHIRNGLSTDTGKDLPANRSRQYVCLREKKEGVVEGGCPTLTSGGWRTSAHHSLIYKRKIDDPGNERVVFTSIDQASAVPLADVDKIYIRVPDYAMNYRTFPQQPFFPVPTGYAAQCNYGAVRSLCLSPFFPFWTKQKSLSNDRLLRENL
jgi:hypothetical protein